MKKTLLILIAITNLCLVSAARAQLVHCQYQAINFWSLTGNTLAFTNPITIQPYPSANAVGVVGAAYVPGPAATFYPTNQAGTNAVADIWLNPNQYRLMISGISVGILFTVSPQTNVFQIAPSTSTGATVFWGTNNYRFNAVVDTNDTTPGFLADKFKPGIGIYFTTNNAGGNEQLLLNISNSVTITVTATNITAVLDRTNLPAAAALVDITNNWTAPQNFPNATATNLAASTFTLGSMVIVATNSAVVFTNATQAGINGVFAQVNSITWTNTISHWSVVTNGTLCSLLNPALQTAWTSPNLFNPVWNVGAAGTGTAPGSAPVAVMSGTVQFSGLVAGNNVQMSGNFSGNFSGTGQGRYEYATNAASATNAQSAVAALGAGSATNALTATNAPDGYPIISSPQAQVLIQTNVFNVLTNQTAIDWPTNGSFYHFRLTRDSSGVRLGVINDLFFSIETIAGSGLF